MSYIEAAKKRISELRDQVNYHNHRYHLGFHHHNHPYLLLHHVNQTLMYFYHLIYL